MPEYKFSLEKGSRKFICPACGKKEFVVYVDNAAGAVLSPEVGKCDRLDKCGYHYAPKQFFLNNPGQTQNGVVFIKKPMSAVIAGPNEPTKLDYIDKSLYLPYLDNYDENNFVQFLFGLVPENKDAVWKAVKDYLIGTFPHQYGAFCSLPYIDRNRRICKVKLMRFDIATGKRLKGSFDTSSLSAMLKLGRNYKQTFFGEHLLTGNRKPLAIVESEKTAVIGSIMLPEFVWLASGSKAALSIEKLKRLGPKKLILYPDADGFADWQNMAQEVRKQGFDVRVSNLIETLATDAEKAEKPDIADYLIKTQIEKNRFVNFYNSKLETVLNDEKLFNDFETILDEQIAVRMIAGNLPEAEAEAMVYALDNLREIVLSV